MKKAEPGSRPGAWKICPLRWYPVEGTAVMWCENGHSASLQNHTIDAHGRVSPSVVCPHEGCGWHVFVKLEGWEGEG